jgi:hypothetical protein
VLELLKLPELLLIVTRAAVVAPADSHMAIKAKAPIAGQSLTDGRHAKRDGKILLIVRGETNRGK